ncbi:MAG: transposase, partial [Tannerella sp.]|nr:transposase [Tannerella sp.]
MIRSWRKMTIDRYIPYLYIVCFFHKAKKRQTHPINYQWIKYNIWEALDREAIDIHLAKTKGEKYIAPVYKNGDSLKQLLARSRYLLFKKESLWTISQKQRADILFKLYPHIKKAYYLSMQLGLIYHQCKFKDVALTRLARWYDQVDRSG